MKALKIFGMAILACSVLFVSCKKDDKKDDSSKSYTITVKANDAAMGTVTGGGSYAANASATLTATANNGYEFVQWQDGNKDNPRTITVTADATYTATFQAKQAAGGTTSISFNSNQWNAANVITVDYSDEGYLTYYIFKTESSQEDTYLLGFLETAAGTYTYAETYDCMKYYDMSYVYTADEAGAAVLQCEVGDQYYGWNADVNSFAETVTGVDLNAHTTTATFTEEIFDIAEYVAAGGQSYGTTKTLNGNMNNAPWTFAESKANSKRNTNSKLFTRVK